MNRNERLFLKKEALKLPKNCIVVEIGSWTGGSSEVFAQAISNKNGMIYCIDTWDYRKDKCDPILFQKAQGRNILKEFIKRMKPYNHRALIGKNEQFLNQFEDGSVDLVFIDADHTYAGAKADVENWLPKVKPGGVLCGHDYGRDEYGVTQAVHEIFGTVENPARSMWKVKI